MLLLLFVLKHETENSRLIYLKLTAHTMGSNHSIKNSKERKTKSKMADLKTLKNIHDAHLVEYGKSKNLNKVYAGHISQG